MRHPPTHPDTDARTEEHARLVREWNEPEQRYQDAIKDLEKRFEEMLQANKALCRFRIAAMAEGRVGYCNICERVVVLKNVARWPGLELWTGECRCGNTCKAWGRGTSGQTEATP